MPWQSFKMIKGVCASDHNPLPHGGCKAIYVGGPQGGGASGDVTVRMPMTEKQRLGLGGHASAGTLIAGDLIKFANVPPGTILPVGAEYVMNTGTTAEDLVTFHG